MAAGPSIPVPGKHLASIFVVPYVYDVTFFDLTVTPDVVKHFEFEVFGTDTNLEILRVAADVDQFTGLDSLLKYWRSIKIYARSTRTDVAA